MAGWQVILYTTQAKDGWGQLPAGLRQQVADDLCRYPYKDPRSNKARRHLKGKCGGRNNRCNREYRSLPNAKRVLYTVDEAAREIHITYCGPHPK